MTRSATISIAISLVAVSLIMLLGRHVSLLHADRRRAGGHDRSVRRAGTRRIQRCAPNLKGVGTRRAAKEYGVFDEVAGKCVGTVAVGRLHRLRHELSHQDHSPPSTAVRNRRWLPGQIAFMICRESPAIYQRGRPVALKKPDVHNAATCCDVSGMLRGELRQRC
jgi:hypothetical protein